MEDLNHKKRYWFVHVQTWVLLHMHRTVKKCHPIVLCILCGKRNVAVHWVHVFGVGIYLFGFWAWSHLYCPSGCWILLKKTLELCLREGVVPLPWVSFKLHTYAWSTLYWVKSVVKGLAKDFSLLLVLVGSLWFSSLADSWIHSQILVSSGVT